MPNIIEITGVPGSGKSLFVKSLQTILDGKLILFNYSYIITQHFPWWSEVFGSKIAGKIYLLTSFIIHIKKYRYFIRYIIKRIWKFKSPISIKLYLFINIILKLGRFEYVEKNMSSSNVVFDEGLSHIPFNLVDYEKEDYVTEKCVYNDLSIQYKNISVIILNVDNSIIQDRIMARGHKRLDSTDLTKLNSFLNSNLRVNDCLRSHGTCTFRSFEVIDTSNENYKDFAVNYIRRLLS